MKADELEKLAALRDRGILTQEEFEQEKKKLLDDSDVIEKSRAFDDGGNVSEFSARAKNPSGRKTGIFQHYTNCWKRYFGFSGRASRGEYWSIVLVNFIVCCVLGVIDGASGASGSLYGLYSIAFFFPMLAAGFRRCHDTNHSGLWMFAPLFAGVILGVYAGIVVAASGGASSGAGILALALVFVFVAAYSFYLLVKKGDAGANEYGEPSV